MRIFWKIFRAIASVLLLLAVVLPAAIYVILSLEPIQTTVRTTASEQLSDLLGADVRVRYVRIHPFNRVTVGGISLALGSDTVAQVETVSAGFDLWPLISKGDIIFDYALLDGVTAHINRTTPESGLNIQPIIDRLRSDRPSEKKKFSVEISTVVIRRASASYDILSAPMPDSALFDPRHIAIKDLAINAFIPQISDEGFRVNLDHLSFTERSGFAIDKLSAKCYISPDEISLEDFSIALPESRFELEPMSMRRGGYANLVEAAHHTPVHITTKDDCVIYPPDFKAFVPILSDMSRRFDLSFDAFASLSAVDMQKFMLSDADAGSVKINLEAYAIGLDSISGMKYKINRGWFDVNGRELATLLSPALKSDVNKTISRLNELKFAVRGGGSLSEGGIQLRTDGTAGKIDIDAIYKHKDKYTTVNSSVDIKGFNAGLFTGDTRLGTVDASAELKTSFAGKLQSCAGIVEVGLFEYKGYPYTGITAGIDMQSPRSGEVNVSINDPAAKLKAYAMYNGDKEAKLFKATATVSDLDINRLGFTQKHEGELLSAKLNINFNNTDLRKLYGSVDISDLRWVDSNGKGLKFDRLHVHAEPDEKHAVLQIETPVIKGSLQGHYDFVSLVPTVKTMVYQVMPALKPEEKAGKAKKKAGPEGYNDFTFDFTISPTKELSEFFKLPLQNLDNATLHGKVDTRSGYAYVDLNAPYLYNGKVIENTCVFGQLDTTGDNSMVYATTTMPTKKGDMTIMSTIRFSDNKIDTHVDWDIARRIPLNGTIDFSATLLSTHTPTGSAFPAEATLDMKPGTINFGDETWSIGASKFTLTPDLFNIDDFTLNTATQSIAIDGNISKDIEDKLSVNLSNVQLLPIFETLEIDKAMIGGRATGHITASELLSGNPHLYCPRLHVDSIGYNRCPIGNAEIKANWDNEQKGVYLDAAITGFEGRHSKIDGFIYPMGEALDINFDADSIPVAFLKPFMEAFASDISGRASGKCRLFGTFKEIDLEGDIYADNVGLKIDFTNTTYHASDSVHIRPGRILLDNIVIRAPDGHTANLTGVVGHTFFKAPNFKFDITQALNFLSYNVTSRQNPDWYGTIYGNGGATITGWPGVVNIGVNMTTAPGSSFTFVLSDRLDAENYSFLTFRDVTPDSLKAPDRAIDDTPLIVRTLKSSGSDINTDEPSQYNMDIAVSVTPDARLTLVMDPAGGDEIKTLGSGNLHMAYHSANNDLNMWGKYTVLSGSYRFTLQDIIIKDFTIKEGSEIQFDGDPYGVKTKLSAYYATNANLSDLDESFLQDKEVARTNVPVHALMQVSGDIRQPVIDFDLEFPTLTQDTYRKVKSIVSTEDMMNRQIIYLLALNRFYTPDYMASTTKGNELFSVASSTISSQLGSMLGKLSENWSISPNLRSDRGDFSDVEVDLALSSRLLNNRLIFNGNFGYRDKALNTNQFVGDFDIEYLLNKRGSWRLKAYNRYNDRNFYVRTAQTTQGVGIMFRRDFDRMFNFLRPNKKHKKDTTETDSIWNPSVKSIK